MDMLSFRSCRALTAPSCALSMHVVRVQGIASSQLILVPMCCLLLQVGRPDEHGVKVPQDDGRRPGGDGAARSGAAPGRMRGEPGRRARRALQRKPGISGFPVSSDVLSEAKAAPKAAEVLDRYTLLGNTPLDGLVLTGLLLFGLTPADFEAKLPEFADAAFLALQQSYRCVIAECRRIDPTAC